jgi:hypothetical protein
MLVTQLFEAEDQAKKADKKDAKATAALLASVQARRDETILEAPTRATIDALVGEGFNAPEPFCNHVKRWADMIRAEYEARTAGRFSHGCTCATSAMGCYTLSGYRIVPDQAGNATIPANTTRKNMEICGPVKAYQL